VLFVKDADQTMVGPIGSEIRYHKHFAPKGTNAKFRAVAGPNHIRVRTYERGVKAKRSPAAPGVGVGAHHFDGTQLHLAVKVQVQGGDQLEVSLTERATSSAMCVCWDRRILFSRVRLISELRIRR
jgi:diaminopimelate epimerase